MICRLNHTLTFLHRIFSSTPFRKLLVNFRASLLTDKAKIIEKSINRINMFSARLFNQAVRIFVEQFVERKFNNLASDVFQAVNETCAKVRKEAQSAAHCSSRDLRRALFSTF